jgi:phosphatidylinositol alpha-1,6-mannosyltransferase
MDRFIRECFPRVLEIIPEARLLLAGGNPVGALLHRDDISKRVHDTLEEVGVADQVRVTGRLEENDMVEAFGLADVAILPVIPYRGDMEGFGIVLLEAAAAGKPTVATRIGGIPDAVEEGVTGYLVEPFDYHSMADRLVELLMDSEKAATMGAAGRQRVVEHFRWDKVGEKYVDFLLGEGEFSKP